MPCLHRNKLQCLQLHQGGSATTTLAGGKGSANGQLRYGITLSNGRQYTQVIDNSGNNAIPGTFSYRSGESGIVSIDGTSGVVTLQDNSHEDVNLEVLVCPSQRSITGGTTAIAANLDPVILGDVDLGSRRGHPFSPCNVGDTRTIEARMNTGGMLLGVQRLRAHLLCLSLLLLSMVMFQL
eukprot:m.216624 g.216624  ORF g.216624 m.216624 type:complete len:181 (+) comp15880_c0_seq2:3216-3758(+)